LYYVIRFNGSLIHRWADIKRFGVAEQIMLAEGKTPNLLFAIPQRELDLNQNFTQNPGY